MRVRVLFLTTLKYEWWEWFNPMTVHWSAQWLAILHEVSTVKLQGILSENCDHVVLQLYQLNGLMSASCSNSTVLKDLDSYLKLPEIAECAGVCWFTADANANTTLLPWILFQVVAGKLIQLSYLPAYKFLWMSHGVLCIHGFSSKLQSLQP
jgi:hypothetical protein